MQYMMQSMMNWVYGGAGLVFWLTAVLVWVVLALLIVYLWKKINNK